MMTTSNDISSRISATVVEVLIEVKALAEGLNIPFFLVGASARDLFFTSLFGLKTRRASLDVDIGIRVGSWDEVTRLVDVLIATGHFELINQPKSKFRHQNGTLVDIVPYGDIENPSRKVQWPGGEAVMTTTGLEDAFKYAMEVQIKRDPAITVRIATPPALVMLKLVAWDEKYPERARDAQDIQYILESYIDAGNDDRLDREDKDLRVEENFDYGLASARMVGRDIAKIASDETKKAIVGILEREIRADSQSRLVTDMNRGSAFTDEKVDQSHRLLLQLKQGLTEKDTP